MGDELLANIRTSLCLRREKLRRGLRELAELVGVSASTLSRFIRGANPDYKTLKKLQAFHEGKGPLESKPRCARRFVVGKKAFIVEIREE